MVSTLDALMVSVAGIGSEHLASDQQEEHEEVQMYDSALKKWLAPSSWFPASTTRFSNYVNGVRERFSKTNRAADSGVTIKQEVVLETSSNASSSSESTEGVEVTGSTTRSERDAKLRAEAVCVDRCMRFDAARHGVPDDVSARWPLPSFEERRQESLVQMMTAHLTRTRAMLDMGVGVAPKHWTEYDETKAVWELQNARLRSIRKRRRMKHKLKIKKKRAHEETRTLALQRMASAEPVVRVALSVAIPRD